MASPSSGDSFDAVVVGAGTAGATAAYHLARAGLRTALLDARPFAEAGARWVNGVPAWMFDRAGVDRPAPPELRAEGEPFTLQAASGLVRLRVASSPTGSVDMRELVARLLRLGREAGVVAFECATLREVTLEGGRPVAVRAEIAESSGGPSRAALLRAELFVDASGLKGALRRRVPALDRHCPAPPRRHLCSAAQEVCAVADREGARTFLEENRIRPGETLCFAGGHGGFSIASIGLDADLETVDLLTGAVAETRWPSGPKILLELKAAHPWIGSRIFGGAGVIPIRRPYDRLAAPGVALVGDAACQVFPAHGSGIGAGMIAAHILAEAVGRHGDPGSEEATWAYQAAAQRELGALLGSFDVFRRLSQSLSGAEIAQLIGSGLVRSAGYRAGLDQRAPSLSAADALAALRGLVGAPSLAARMTPAVVAMPRVRRMYRRYPRRVSLPALRRWSHRVARLFREPADLA